MLGDAVQYGSVRTLLLFVDATRILTSLRKEALSVLLSMCGTSSRRSLKCLLMRSRRRFSVATCEETRCSLFPNFFEGPSDMSGDLPSSKQRNKSKKKENTKKEVQSAQNTHITIREFNKVAHSSKPSSVSTNRTELMPRSVSTNRTLICVKLFCLTGISMFIVIIIMISLECLADY